MKKLLALSVLLATSVSVSANPPSGGFVDGSNRTVSTVQQALKAADDIPVTLVGYIVERDTEPGVIRRSSLDDLFDDGFHQVGLDGEPDADVSALTGL